MPGLWTGDNTTEEGKSRRGSGVLWGLALAVGASGAALAAQAALTPILPHSGYVLGAPALLACVLLGGARASLLAGLFLAAGGIALDSWIGAPMTDGLIRGAIWGALGAAGWAISHRLDVRRSEMAELAASQGAREALLESSLATMPDAVVVIDAAGTIQSFNRAAERLFGWTSVEAIGRRIGLLVPTSQADELGGYVARFMDSDEAGVVGSAREATGVRKDGSEFPMEARFGAVHAGEQRFFTVVIRDLTTFEEAEQRLAEMRAQLTQVWSLNSMGEMASVLAHELNQPLSAVTNYLRAARNLIANLELEDDDLIDAVTRAGDQALRAGEIIRTMRDLATRGGTLQKPESLGAIISEVDFLVSLMARDAGVRVFYDLYKGDDTVIADRIQIQQLVVNLARNAIEAVTKYPQRQVNVSTRPDSEGNILTTVEDSGPGVDPHVSERLFQPLASTKPEGMGLGLSISSAIVENHRGRIWVEPSRLGGAAFCFVLARAGEDGDASGRSDGVRH